MALQRLIFAPRFCRANGSDLRGEDGYWKELRTRFSGRCASSDLPLSVGSPVAWYPVYKQMHLLIPIRTNDIWYTQPALGSLAVRQLISYRYVAAVYAQYQQALGQDVGPDLSHQAILNGLASAFQTAQRRQTTVYLHEFDLEACWATSNP